jgi:hypothetical protein
MEGSVMIPKRTTSVIFATACLTAIVIVPIRAQTAGSYAPTASYNGQQFDTAQASQGDVASSAAARRNVIESREYDRALETNRAFRQSRMRKECDPITDPQLRQNCLESFRQDEPFKGSSRSSRGERSGSNR